MMTERLTQPNERNQKQIDAGCVALLRLDPSLTALARATAIQLAKDGGIEDARVCMAEACALVSRVVKREAFCRRYSEHIR
jgi:hypothetical protein